MRSLRTLLLTTLLLATTTVSSFAGEITVNVNKTKVNFPDVKPYTKEGRTLVPIRFVADHLGAETSWNEEKQTATIKKDEKTIDLCLRCKKILVNGKEVKTEAIGEKKDDKRTMVPLRFLSENFGAKVDWNEKTLTVDITTTTNGAISVTPPPTPAPTKPVQIREIPRSELPKEFTEGMGTIEKIYNGVGIEWDIKVDFADKKEFSILSDPFPFTTYYVIFTDGTMLHGRSGGFFPGNHLGKTIDKIFVNGGNWKYYYVDIDDITIVESK